MFPAADPVLTADAGPTLLGASLRVGLVVLLLAAVGWAWLFWLKRSHGATRRLEIQERVFLTRGAGVALLRVDDRSLLVGISAEGVRLISELDGPRRTSFAGVLAQITDEEATG